jgi:hypothetical protein
MRTCWHCSLPLQKLWDGVGSVLVVSGHYEANADMMPTLRVIDVELDLDAAAAAADSLAGLETATAAAAEPHTPSPQPAISEELAPFVVEGEALEQDLVRQLSSRMSLRRGSLSTPLKRQFSKAA